MHREGHSCQEEHGEPNMLVTCSHTAAFCWLPSRNPGVLSSSKIFFSAYSLFPKSVLSCLLPCFSVENSSDKLLLHLSRWTVYINKKAYCRDWKMHHNIYQEEQRSSLDSGESWNLVPTSMVTCRSPCTLLWG